MTFIEAIKSQGCSDRFRTRSGHCWQEPGDRTRTLLEEGRLNALAVGGSRRLTGFPNVPSLGDLGLLKFDVEVWFGLLAPKGTPTPVVDLLAKEIKRVLNEPGMFEKFDVLGFTIVGSTRRSSPS